MVISGVIIHTIQGEAEKIKDAVCAIEGIELQHIEKNAQIIVTLEAENLSASEDVCKQIAAMKHVTGIFPAYINFEDEAI